jgi:hypothetical protein
MGQTTGDVMKDFENLLAAIDRVEQTVLIDPPTDLDDQYVCGCDACMRG